MLRLIESYSDTARTHLINGRSYPCSSVLEDDDGVRWYLLPDPGYEAIHAPTYARAVATGASALLYIIDGLYVAMTTATFMDNRTEARNEYRTDAWRVFQAMPSYRDLIVSATVPKVSRSGFVHLHTHSEFSSWDGLSTVKEIVTEACADNQPAVSINDHGTCAGHPTLQRETDKAGIKPIFGIEAYFTDDRFTREPQADGKDYLHLILMAKNNVGLKNLWACSTEAFRDGFYSKPRMDWSTLERHREGLIVSTGCLSGPLAVAITADDESLTRHRLGRLLSIFGDDLYLELHANSLVEQRKVNERLVVLGKEFGVPLVGVVDSHFPRQQDAHMHRLWMACATSKEVTDEAEILGFGEELHVMSEAKVREAFAYLGPQVVDEAVGNTLRIADQCDAKIEGVVKSPVYSKASTEHPNPVRRDEERLLDMCMAAWERRTVGKREGQDVYIARFEREFKLLVDKGFCGYFLMVADYVQWAKDNGILVGPGRGSGGGSLVAYLTGITEVDPVDADLLFERFLTEGRTALPDFDVDFPTSKRQELQNYLRDKYGADYVMRVGTHTRFKSKGIVKKLGKAFASQYPDSWKDLEFFSKVVTEAEISSAGLGISWDDLWVQEEERLNPLREKYPDLFAAADILVGRLNSYGKHAAGMVISTDFPLTDQLPLRGGEDDESMVSQFEMEDLENLGLVKFDLLTIRTLDTIQMAVDLIRDKRGIAVNVYDWKDEYEDPQVWDEVSAAKTLGIFQIETTSGTRLTRQMQPRSVAELADMITLVRPGPMRSGLTATYLKRRDGLEQSNVPDPRLEPVLAKTYGCLLYQEDIMATTMVLAHYDSNEADKVRKILGKKQVEKVATEGQKFVTEAVQFGMEATGAAGLWAQMAEFAKYSFNRAHAYAYAMVGYWCAWLKFHFPVEFLTAALSTVDKDRIPDFIQEARRMKYEVLPPDINESGIGFHGTPLAVRYGLDSIKGIATAAVHIKAGQPYASYDDFMNRMVEPKGSKVNRGNVATLARIGAFDSLVANRRGLETRLEQEKTGESTRCVNKDDTVVNHGLPCTFDWDNEPPIINPRSGKTMKPKPPPARCTKACRRYTAPQPIDIDLITPYTDEEIRDIEHELLGVYLSSSPFDRVPEAELEACMTGEQLMNAASGTYIAIAILSSIRTRPDRTGRMMAFSTFVVQDSDLDVAIFGSVYGKYESVLKAGTLCVTEIEKKGDRFNLVSFMPL